jgi:hypothetical protein
VGHVAQAESHAHAIEIRLGEWQALGIATHRGSHASRVKHAVAAAREHRAVDVAHPDFGSARGERARQVAAAGGDIEHALARADTRDGNSECLPQAVHSERHQVVHQVVPVGDSIEYLADAFCFFFFGNSLEAKIGVSHAHLLPAGTRFVHLFQIRRPEAFLVLAQVVEVVPGVNSGRVAIGKRRLHRVRPHRLKGTDLHVGLSHLQHFLSRPVAAHFCRGRMHPQEFIGKPESPAVGKRDLQRARFLMQRNAGRRGPLVPGH